MNTDRKDRPQSRTRHQSSVRLQANRFSSLNGSARRWVNVEDFDVEPSNDSVADEASSANHAAAGLVFRIPDTFYRIVDK